MPEHRILLHAAALIAAGLGAALDIKTGRIPNWLTLPLLLIAPPTLFAFDGLPGLVDSLLGVVACGIVPWLMFTFGRAMRGGDVKLFAALGALTGWFLAIGLFFYSLIAAGVFATAWLAWRGELVDMLRNSMFLLVNPLLPESRRRRIPRESMHPMRFGGAIFAGTVAVIVEYHLGV